MTEREFKIINYIFENYEKEVVDEKGQKCKMLDMKGIINVKQKIKELLVDSK